MVSVAPIARRPHRPARGPVGRRRAARAIGGTPDLDRRAAILAHDLNNLLGVILAASEALAAAAPDGSAARDLARASQDAAERGGDLLRRFTDEAARRTRARAPISDAGQAAAEVARMARLSAPSGVSVRLARAGGGLACAADTAELQSALLNLCRNAGHATRAPGRIRISARRRRDDIAISVSDTGCGMSPDVLARCGEAHFTTRRGRGGAGLGLAAVRDFAQRAGGRLELRSREGRGTTATLVLPRA